VFNNIKTIEESKSQRTLQCQVEVNVFILQESGQIVLLDEIKKAQLLMIHYFYCSTLYRY